MIKKISEGVYEVQNFLTKDELFALLLSTEEDGFIESHRGNIVKDLVTDSTKYLPKINDKIMSHFENAQSQTPITNVRRLLKGEYMDLHSDGGYPESKKTIVYGVIIYLNDDFVGGELSYPTLNFSIKPKSCSMLIHEAHLPHKVLPVKDGIRYSLTTFIFGDKTTKIKI